MTTFKEVANTASEIISVVGPIIKLTMPGSDVAAKIASALDMASDYLRFGQNVNDTTLVNLQNDMLAIKAEVDAMAALGPDVPTGKWDAVNTDIDDSVKRIRAAMGVPDPASKPTTPAPGAPVDSDQH